MRYPDISTLTFTPKKGYPSVEDLAKYVLQILALGLPDQLTKDILKVPLNWMADYSGKGLHCQFRSERADKKCGNLKKWETKLGLIHDHIIPKELIATELIALTDSALTVAEVERLLRLSVYCLVTRNPDDTKFESNKLKQKMPNNKWTKPNAEPNHIWARYEHTDIPVLLR